MRVVWVLLAATLVVAVVAFSGILSSTTLTGEAPVQAPAGAVAFVQVSATYEHLGTPDWSARVAATVGAIDTYTPRGTPAPTLERSGDEADGAWIFDGDVSISDWMGNKVAFWELAPEKIETGDGGQHLYRVTFRTPPLFLLEPGSYTVTTAAHVSFAAPDGTTSGSHRVTAYQVIEFV